VDFQDEYAVALADFVTTPRSLVPDRAVQLGQKASANGLSALTILNVHDYAVQRIYAYQSGPCEHAGFNEQSIEFVSMFFRQSLAAYEAANAQLTRENCTLLQLNEALEEQASRIAEALHDDAGQVLTVAQMKLTKAEQTASPECAAYLTEIQALFDKIKQQLRRFSNELRPAALHDCGLITALDLLVQGVAGRARLTLNLDGAEDIALPERLETVVYRFVQEGLTNIVRHANAKNVIIRFRQTAEKLMCLVIDDGVGFDPTNCRLGMGLSGMRQRVQAAAGTLSVNPNPGGGAELKLEIPLEDIDDASAHNPRR